MPWVRNFEGLLDFLSLVIVHAPDDFPKEDYLRDDEQLTLEMAFEEIGNGMRFVVDKIPDEKVLQQLRSHFNSSLAAYRQGDDIKGAHFLQNFERIILEQNY